MNGNIWIYAKLKRIARNSTSLSNSCYSTEASKTFASLLSSFLSNPYDCIFSTHRLAIYYFLQKSRLSLTSYSALSRHQATPHHVSIPPPSPRNPRSQSQSQPPTTHHISSTTHSNQPARGQENRPSAPLPPPPNKQQPKARTKQTLITASTRQSSKLKSQPSKPRSRKPTRSGER